MNKELIMALDALEKENGIDKEIMFAAIEKSLMDEYKAEFDKADNGRVELDRRTGDFLDSFYRAVRLCLGVGFYYRAFKAAGEPAEKIEDHSCGRNQRKGVCLCCAGCNPDGSGVSDRALYLALH